MRFSLVSHEECLSLAALLEDLALSEQVLAYDRGDSSSADVSAQKVAAAYAWADRLREWASGVTVPMLSDNTARGVGHDTCPG